MISNRSRPLIACAVFAVIAFGNGSHAIQTRASTALPAQSDGAARIKPEEVADLLKKDKAVLVDVRGVETYKAGHIKGALSIPSNEIRDRAKELPRNKMIVTYCSWPAEHSSAGAVLTLKELGITNAAAVLGGYDALVKAGLGTEKSN